MAIIDLNLFPGGVRKCVTFSYDDGTAHDRRLVAIMNEHGIKGSFHLNSGKLGRENFITAEEVATLYAGHEVSVHTVTHPFATRITNEELVGEVMDDRRALERLVGYPVRGMSYPFGDYDDRVVGILRTLGIQCSRTTRATGQFPLPSDPLMWHPTCHHRSAADLVDAFLADAQFGQPRLFFLWGHSYEFANNDNWDLIEGLCRRLGGRDDVWYATNIQVADYLNAQRSLRVSADLDIVHNPSALAVWFTHRGTDPVEVKPGRTLALA
ncbi:MAG: polysaccharide deacetylase family protein [Planctomycetes bacterium]|nr:polysaccharide deacetylase family protein [Planctomycetota bacterium]